MKTTVRMRLGLSVACAALAAACGSSSEIAGDRDPIVAKDDDTPEPPPDTPACNEGFAPPGGAGQKCDFVARGLCFGTSTVACECAGCAADKCMILESYPAQIRCQ
jgi:hypothetical protein